MIRQLTNTFVFIVGLGYCCSPCPEHVRSVFMFHVASDANKSFTSLKDKDFKRECCLIGEAFSSSQVTVGVSREG